MRSVRLYTTKAVAAQADENSTSSAIFNSKSVAAVILGGGAGTRLYPLTKSRAKPAVPIGGAYRLIDVPMSNCLNSGISKMYILTQFNSVSLNRHLARTYNFGNGIMYGGSGFVGHNILINNNFEESLVKLSDLILLKIKKNLK